MTADYERDISHCLVCDYKVGTSSRSSIRIFNETSVTAFQKPLLDTITTVLEVNLNEQTAHSLVVCKKCYKLFNEVVELEHKLLQIKQDLSSNYQKTINKITDLTKHDEEYNNDHDYINNLENQAMEIELKDEEEISDSLNCKENEKEFEVVEEMLEENNEIEESENVFVNVEAILDANNEPEKKSSKKSKSNVKEETVQEQIVMREGAFYVCLICFGQQEKVIADSKTIIKHMKEIHETRLYICDVCGDDFRKRNQLSLHLDEHVATEEGDFQCEVCNRIFNNLRLFRIHKRIHYPQVKSWPCDTCGKRYSSRNLLEEHINTHTGIRPHICEICGKDFASKYTYKAHIKTHEVRPRPYGCSQCNKTFLSQQNLNQHERTHNGVKDHVCHQCGKAFGSPHNLEVHNVVHTGYKPYICRICGKAFARKAEIRDHERTHTGEKPYQCEFCGATFSQRSNLQSHKRATHYNDKRYKCSECDKGFKRRRLLDYHIKAAHTGERPYKCNICSATFVYPEHFKKHMRIHTGEKPYLCEVCGKAFNSRDNRNAHRFIHSDKKPYECLHCGAGFMRKPLLYTHMQTQGHLNDTIVVNQPRLTTEDEQVITIPENNAELLMDDCTNNQIEETALYVTDLKDHVIIQQDDNQIYNEEGVLNIPVEENVVGEEVDQITVDEQMDFTERDTIVECQNDETNQVEEVYTYNDSEEGETAVPHPAEYKEIVEEEKHSAVRLVQIKFPSSVSEEGRRWLSLVQNT
ncbi:PREDICTED: zinc finger protein 2 homolog [Polistes dominula]|uniref:Zinc finger protein 2 homolog n=1 Tax=Polistes dominula TaxID=743375 RepID=A0ABM1I5D3_POLDO|nr:PREDICTED: zinc finger protein 2 homolog [Polistes dominula]XP_015175420.1 PREDICTED: zinc finger protein 2 homolog [Polistes dominula]